MNVDDRLELFFEHRDMAYRIAQTYFKEINDIDYYIDIITDYALDGLMRAVYSINDKKQLNHMDFKSYALFYIKSEMNKKLIH